MEDKRAKTQWLKSNISYTNYQDFLKRKKDKFELTFIDLLYVSNFKGGNSTINEVEKEINNKLKKYSEILIEIHQHFEGKHLKDLQDEEIRVLVNELNKLCALTKKNSKYKIDGFSVSYLSALLSFYFPNILPILDRRVLINSGLITGEHANKQGQVINIENHYEPLIRKIKDKCLQGNCTIRQVDQEFFIIKIEKRK